jgi:hypothetical protein
MFDSFPKQILFLEQNEVSVNRGFLVGARPSGPQPQPSRAKPRKDGVGVTQSGWKWGSGMVTG